MTPDKPNATERITPATEAQAQTVFAAFTRGLRGESSTYSISTGMHPAPPEPAPLWARYPLAFLIWCIAAGALAGLLAAGVVR
jgi:hypothetical protein